MTISDTGFRNLEVLEVKYMGQSITTWATAFGLVFIFSFGLYMLRRVVERKLHRLAEANAGTISRRSASLSVVESLVSGIQPITLLLVSAYLASAVLTIPPRLEKFFDHAIIILLILQIGMWGNRVILFWIENFAGNREVAPPERSALVSVLGFACRLVWWGVLTLILLNNLGIDITALVAGLGVGGLAVALAVQSILGDLFASLTIALDQPFVVGDSIQVDNESGVIERIGLKTTRMRSVNGEQIIFANADLLKSRIRNFRRLTERRVVIRFGVTFGVAVEQLRRIPDLVRAFVLRHEPWVRLDHVHLVNIGESDLKFELIYFVVVPDYARHLDIQQAVINDLFEHFQKEKIPLSLPGRSVEIQRLPITQESFSAMFTAK